MPMLIFPNGGLCEFCDQKEATALCSTCNQIFCKPCQKAHKKAKVAMDHEFVSLDQYDPKKKIKTCSKHPTQQLEILCQTCEEPICLKCIPINHNQHKVVYIKEFAQEAKR